MNSLPRRLSILVTLGHIDIGIGQLHADLYTFDGEVLPQRQLDTLVHRETSIRLLGKTLLTWKQTKAYQADLPRLALQFVGLEIHDETLTSMPVYRIPR